MSRPRSHSALCHAAAAVLAHVAPGLLLQALHCSAASDGAVLYLLCWCPCSQHAWFQLHCLSGRSAVSHHLSRGHLQVLDEWGLVAVC